MGHDPSFDADRNLLVLGERRLVFHCHHYNVFLQRSIEDMFEDAVAMQVSAAKESARHILAGIWTAEDAPLEARLRDAAAVFGENGFGRADASGLTIDGGDVVLATSHYAVGWQAKWGTRKQGVCHFATGYWAGALAAAAGISPERVQAHETQCAVSGADACRIHVEVR